MTTSLLWVFFLLVACIDWWSVASGRADVERWAKPSTLLVLIMVALALPFDPAAAKVAIVIGLFCGLVGDVLLLPTIDRFMGGLISFFVGHVAYVIALLQVGVASDAWLIVAGGATVMLLAVAQMPRLLAAVSDNHGALYVPVAGYVVVILAMTVAAFVTGRLLLAGGAVLFVASDRLLAEDRFVEPRPSLRWLVHVLYHLGQAGLVAGMAL